MQHKKSYFRNNRIMLYDYDTCLPSFIPQLGWGQFRKAQKRQPYHLHEHNYEICYISKGSVHWHTGGIRSEINRGQVYIVKPGEIHGGVNTFMHPSEIYWLEFSLEEFTSYFQAEANTLETFFNTLTIRHLPVDQQIPHLFRKIIEENRQQDHLNAELTLCYCAELLFTLSRQYQSFIRDESKKEKKRSAKIQEAVNWMTTHFDKQWSVEEAAEKCQLKVSRFHQLFIDETGYTPTEFINRYRIDLAKRKLTTTNIPVTDIAFSLGFSTSQYFATVFKKYCGITPRKYRMQNAASNLQS